MRFAFLEEHRKLDEWSTTIGCRELRVSRSGYYAWSNRQDESAEPSARQKRHQELLEQVRLSFLRSRQRYGAPRVTADLKSRGIAVCLNTVAKIMRESGLAAKRRRRFVPRTTDSNHNCRVAPNRLKRQFKIDQINRVWAGDISYIPSEEGWLYHVEHLVAVGILDDEIIAEGQKLLLHHVSHSMFLLGLKMQITNQHESALIFTNEILVY